MFAEECRRAIMAAPRSGLDALAKAVWQALWRRRVVRGRGVRAVRACRQPPGHPKRPKRSPASPSARGRGHRLQHGAPKGLDGLRMASSGHRERGFTMGEAAAIGVIVAEIAKHGRCELYIGAIAGRAGVCATIVKRALRQARSLGLFHVRRRVAWPAIDVCRTSSRSSAERSSYGFALEPGSRCKGGGGTSVPTTTNHILSSSARPTATAWTEGTFVEVGRKVWASRMKAEPATWLGFDRDTPAKIAFVWSWSRDHV